MSDFITAVLSLIPQLTSAKCWGKDMIERELCEGFI